ncbi:hypothetical protein SAMN05421690_10568 [Nitrosomonas sp. Nm51]|nr:hypothetical protein SAMN05421690_10568 [Nitrosomonas sp. Nm51]
MIILQTFPLTVYYHSANRGFQASRPFNLASGDKSLEHTRNEMNIFVLDLDIKKCAQYDCDQHVSKMILESAQLLCTALKKGSKRRIARLI